MVESPSAARRPFVPYIDRSFRNQHERSFLLYNHERGDYMIITGKNIKNYFDGPRYIVFPRKQIFATYLFHGFIYHLSILLIYNVFSYIGVPLFAYEVYHSLVFMGRLWQLMGYSMKLYYIAFVVITIGNFLVAIPERAFLAEFIGTYIL